MKRLWRSKGFLPLLLLLLVAAIGPFMVGQDPRAIDVAAALQPPSAVHWFGTDQLGRDIFARVLHAAWLDLSIAFASVLLSLGIGSILGASLGYFGGRVGSLGSRLTDVLMAFPLFALAFLIVAVLGNTVANVILAISLVNLPFYIRLAAHETAARRTLGYVDAARMGGFRDGAIITRILLPNIAAPLVVHGSTNLGWAILSAAGLSFLGLGIRPPTPEWGAMVAEGARFMFSGEWWLVAFPGLALTLSVLVFTQTGDHLRTILTPEREG